MNTLIECSSYNYWIQDPNKISQKFYLTFCLYISAILDFTVANELKQKRILNWSAVSSYYSMLHTGRLIIFIVFGDYPTSHSNICKFFNDKQDIKCNWLKNFDSSNDRTNISFDELCEYYEDNLKLKNVREKLRKFGEKFEKARKLRNDSNYESLLIAHEHNHVYVTSSFMHLSKIMISVSRSSVETATKCFHNYIENDNCLNKDRYVYQYFVEKYIDLKIYDRIKENDSFNNGILQTLRPIISSLEDIYSTKQYTFNNSTVTEKFNRLEEKTSMKMFSGKTELMKEFAKKINDLN